MASVYTSKSSDRFTPFNLPGNAERFQEVARKELGETEELKEECLKLLRKLIKDNNIACITKDDFLLRFLRTKKFDVQRSFQAVQNYAKQRAALHNGFLKLQPETLETVLRLNILGFLPYRDADERLIFFSVPNAWNPDICTEEEIVQIILLAAYYIAESQSSQTTGCVLVHNAINFPWALIPYLLRHMRTLSNVAFNGLPVRYRGLHCINESTAFRFFFKLTRPFYPMKIMERVHLHGESREILFQHLAPTIVPDDFGGSLGPLNNNHLIEDLLDYLEKFKDEQRYFFPKNV